MRDLNKRRLDVALEKDSDTLASLEKDARLRHMSDQLGKMAAIRLADYYLLCEKLGTYSTEGILAALELLASRTVVVGEASSEQIPNNVSKLREEEACVAPAETLDENINEAADIWGSM
jgi:hypothetical protein